MTQLRSRYWMMDCNGSLMGVKVTESFPGQFDTIPYKDYPIPCPFDQCSDRHVMHIVAESTYLDWAAAVDGDDDPLR